jgi:hypothetical protein
MLYTVITPTLYEICFTKNSRNFDLDAFMLPTNSGKQQVNTTYYKCLIRFGRCTYNCTKAPTGPLNRKALLDYIYEQAKKTPDKVEYVPHVPGVIRGTKWVPPPQVTKDILVFLNVFHIYLVLFLKVHIWAQQSQWPKRS